MTTIFIFIIIPFKYALLTKREVVNMTGYMAKFLFFRILLDFLKVLYFFLVGYATRLVTRSVAERPHALIQARLRSI